MSSSVSPLVRATNPDRGGSGFFARRQKSNPTWAADSSMPFSRSPAQMRSRTGVPVSAADRAAADRAFAYVEKGPLAGKKSVSFHAFGTAMPSQTSPSASVNSNQTLPPPMLPSTQTPIVSYSPATGFASGNFTKPTFIISSGVAPVTSFTSMQSPFSASSSEP